MNKAEQIAGQIDALAALKTEKAQVKARIHASGQKISQISQQIVSPVPATASGLFSVGSLVSNGLAIYQGVKMGSRFIRSITSIFRHKR